VVETQRALEAAAARFLDSGRFTGADPVALTAACDRLVRAETQRSLPKALALAGKFVKFTRLQPEMPLQVALRALAWAKHCSGKYADAQKTYLEARSLVTKSPFDRAQIDKILIDVYMYLGQPAEARRRARMALAAFKRMGELDQVAKTRINYGNLLHRQDRHREARRQYEAAREHLEAGRGNELVLGLCYYNLGNTLVQLFEFDGARRYYEKARENFRNQHQDLFANESDYGLAWLAVLNNDYHVALNLLYQCEEKYQQAGQMRGVLLCVLDRAEAYLGLNLFIDALDAAREAERRARRLGVHYEIGKASFFRARAAYALGRNGEATRSLTRAHQAFQREGNKEFDAAVRLFEIQIVSGKTPTPARLQRIRSGLADRQLPLWAAIGDLQLLTTHPGDEAARRRLSRNPAVKSVPYLMAHFQTLEGDREFERGGFDHAMEHWTRATEVLDLVRAKLPPVELRSTFVRGRTDPYERIIAGVLRDNPERAAAWIDRLKTVGVWAAPGAFLATTAKRTQAEESLTRLAQQVSALAEQIGPVAGTRSSDVDASHRSLRRFQREARDRLAMMEPAAERLEPWFDRFQRKLHTVASQLPVVQFCLQNEDIVALVHQNGAVHVHRYGGARRLLQQWSGAWQVQLNRSLLSENGCSRGDLADEHRLFT